MNTCLPDFAPRMDTPLVKPYWDALERGEMVLPACSVCGKWQWYPYEFVSCHGEAQLDWRPVPKTGTVFAFSIVHRHFLPNAARDSAPYVSALVELDGIAGVRIATILINTGEDRPRIGMKVKLHPLARTGYTAPAFEPT